MDDRCTVFCSGLEQNLYTQTDSYTPRGPQDLKRVLSLNEDFAEKNHRSFSTNLVIFWMLQESKNHLVPVKPF